MGSISNRKRAAKDNAQPIMPRTKKVMTRNQEDKENVQSNTPHEEYIDAFKTNTQAATSTAAAVNVEEQARSRTPPPPASATQRNEKTPGRVGPIIHKGKSAEIKIAPFKGPKGHRVRKSRQEKDDEYREHALKDPNHVFHELYVCFYKGPNGSPTYDEAGFELDYDKVARWIQPEAYNKSKMMSSMDRSIARRAEERKKMAKIFFEPGAVPADHPELCRDEEYWKDRVSKDLGVPWHKIGVEHFEEWEKLGFPKAKAGEYMYCNASKADKDRMMGLLTGASLRK